MAFVKNPSAPGTLYTVIARGPTSWIDTDNTLTVYATDDFGTTWFQATQPLPFLLNTSLPVCYYMASVDPSPGNITFDGISQSLFVVVSNNVWRVRPGRIAYSISGQVTDGGHNPVSSVTVTAMSGASTSTDTSGYYTLTGLISGTYIFTPTLSGNTFSPPTRTVILPPDAAGQDFVSTSIFPSLKVTLSPVYPFYDTIPITVMCGGSAHRYYTLHDDNGSLVSGAVIRFQVANLYSDQTTSDGAGLVNIGIDTSILTNYSGMLPVTVTQVLSNGTPVMLEQAPTFNLVVTPTQFSTAWAGGGTVNGMLGSGFGVPGLSLYLKGDVGGGMEMDLHETTSLSDNDDSLSISRRYSVGGGVGGRLGPPDAAFGPAKFEVGPEVSAEVLFKAIQELEIELNNPYTDASKKAEAAFLLAILMDISKTADPLPVAVVQAFINDHAYLNNVSKQSTAIGAEATFHEGFGANIKFPAGYKLGLTLLETELTLLLYGEHSDYPQQHLRGLALEQGFSAGLVYDQMNILESVRKAREELFFNKSTGAIDHFELTLTGKSRSGSVASETTIKYIIDGASVNDSMLAELRNLAALKATYNNVQGQNFTIGAQAMLSELNALVNHVPLAKYQVEISYGPDWPPINVPGLSLQGTGTIDIGLGGGVSVETRRRSTIEEGVVMLGGRRYPLAVYQPYDGPSGKSFTDLMNNAMQGAWLLVKDSFINVIKSVQSGVNWVVGLTTSDGGALLSGQFFVLNSTIKPVSVNATSGITATINAIGWSQTGFAVGGIYRFAPEDMVITPSATLAISYTQGAATGLNPAKFLIYRWDSHLYNWVPLPSTVNSASRIVTATTSRLGTFAIGYDVTPPQITPLLPTLDNRTIDGHFPPLTVIITDTGSGINPASVVMKVNNRIVPSLYDPYQHLAWYTSTLPLANGVYTLSVSAADTIGNSTNMTLDFHINMHFKVYVPMVSKRH